MITHDTRLESYLQRPCSKRKQDILQALGNDEMTARQIAIKLGFTDLNAVKPRLTELKNEGVIEAIGKAYDMATERNVAVFRRTADGN